MTAPHIGPPTHASGCAHRITPAGHTCGHPPAVHIAVFTGDVNLVHLVACRRHAAIARATGDPIAEHPYEPRCDTGTCWPVNANRVPDERDRQTRRQERRARQSSRILLAIGLAIATIALILLVQGVYLLAWGGRP